MFTVALVVGGVLLLLVVMAFLVIRAPSTSLPGPPKVVPLASLVNTPVPDVLLSSYHHGWISIWYILYPGYDSKHI
jgi:hypothetical protein